MRYDLYCCCYTTIITIIASNPTGAGTVQASQSMSGTNYTQNSDMASVAGTVSQDNSRCVSACVLVFASACVSVGVWREGRRCLGWEKR